MSAPRLPLAALLALLSAAAWLAGSLRLESGFAPFFGSGPDPLLSQASAALAEGPLSRQIVLRVIAPTPQQARAAAADLAAALASHAEIEAARAGPDPAWRDAFVRLFAERAVLHWSERPEDELPGRLSPRGLADATRRLREALAGGDGLWLAPHASGDPLLALPAAAARVEALEGGIRVVDGGWTSADGAALVLATTRHSPFATSHQDPLQRFLTERFASLDQAAGGALELEQASLHRFAVASARIAAREAGVLSGLALAGAILFFLASFGSLRLLLLAAVPLVAGTLVGTAVTQLAYGDVHVLTLAFGASLIGVCIDYPIHLMSHHALAGSGSPLATLRSLAPALALGGATTVAGFAGLLFSGFAGVREMGTFACAGVLGGLLAACAVTAPWLPAEIPVRALPRWIAERAERALAALERRPRAGAAMLLAALALGASGLARADWTDDVFALNVALDGGALAEDRRARAGVADVAAGRVFLAFGRDDEEALARNDALALCLADARDAGELASFRSLHALLWSGGLQRRNHAALAARPGLEADLRTALAAEGFRAERFERFWRALAASPPPLRMEEVRASPVGEWVDRFRIELPNGVALVTFFDERADVDALVRRCGSLPGARLLDQRALVSGSYRGDRARTLSMLPAAVIGIIALTALRHRRVAEVLAATLPAILSAAAALGLLAWLGEPLHLVHLLGALLVLGCGVDYGLFVVEACRDPGTRPATLTSAITSCLTTVLGFGLLGLSSFPVLRALGLSAALGSALSLALVLAATAAFRLRAVR